MVEVVWKGDPQKCKYCIKKIFPHEHDVAAFEAKKAQTKTAAPKKVADPTQPKRGRGRPPSQKTLELLAVCQCKTASLSTSL